MSRTTDGSFAELTLLTSATRAAVPYKACTQCKTEGWKKNQQVYFYPTSYRSEERWVFSAASVCLFVCQHDNFRTSKHRMMKLGGR